MKFDKLENIENLKQFVKDNFEVDLPIDGGWGYSLDDATEIAKNPMPTKQIEHIFATVRTNIEMYLMLAKKDRFGGINLKEINRDTKDDYEIVEYEIEAIKEDIYADLINEYKEGYGKDDFDMDAHFKKREEATFRRVGKFYFKTLHTK